MTDRWLTCQEIARWASAAYGREVAIRTVQGWCHSQTNPLPHTRLGKRILVKTSDLRTWLETGGVAAQVAVAADRGNP